MKPAGCACEAEVDIRVSSVEEMRRNAAALFQAHFEEVAVMKERRELDPDWPQYYALEDADRLFAFAAWHKGELVGYSATIVIPRHLHYSKLRCAMNDVLFVSKEFRLSSVGTRLRKLTKDEAKKRGCTEIVWHCKKHSEARPSPFHLLLEASKSCVLQDIIYSEVLE